MNVNIAVVDDLKIDCERIEEYIDCYFSDRKNKPVRIGRYYNAEDFLKTYRKGEYQIMFLDICMGEMNGLELAGRIRKCDNDIRIIFMSTTREFVFQSFAAVPEGYLCKPYEYAAFAEVMDRTLYRLFAKEKYLKIQLPHGEAEIAVSEIVSVLSNNHSVNLKMITGEELESSMLFSKLQEILEHERDLKYPVFAVLTRIPTDDLRQIHDRMPLILPKSAIDEWISLGGKHYKVVDKALIELVTEKAI